MTTPQISVVMPVYNREQYLKESIESILHQTFTDFEFIIVDDQSTDSSWQIIQEYANKDSRIVAIKNTGKKGCFPSRNCGNKLAKGKYIAVMDSDDISIPERLQTQFDFMEQNPEIGICGSWIQYFGTNNKILRLPTNHKDIRDLTFFGCAVANGVAIYRTSLNIEYSTDFNCAEDFDLWCRKIDETKFANIPKTLLLCRAHGNQISTESRKNQDNVANGIRIANIKKIGIDLSTEEEKISCDLFLNQFNPSNADEIVTAIKICEKISVAGKHFGYGKKFRKNIRTLLKRILRRGITNKIFPTKLYTLTFIKYWILNY